MLIDTVVLSKCCDRAIYSSLLYMYRLKRIVQVKILFGMLQ